MGFGASNDLREASEQEPLGVDPKRTNTNEQGRPLPYFAGIAKLGVTWISEPWDVRSKPITKKVGKKMTVILYGKNFWNKIIDFKALVKYGMISPEDMDLFSFADTPKEAFDILKKDVLKNYSEFR